MRMNTAIVEVDRPWLAMSSMLIVRSSDTQRNFPEHCTADAWQGLFQSEPHAAGLVTGTC